MGFFNIFKKKNKKEDKRMSTLDEVRKVYEDLSDEDKNSFRQSIAEPEQESGGEESGTKEEKPAEEGAQEPSVEEDTEEKEPEGTSSEESTSEEGQKDVPLGEIGERLSRIEAAIVQLTQQGKRTPTPADDATADRLKRAEQIYS